MSISRRGLLAAGLAVAAVGTIGVVSTMNASADETPAVVTTATDPTETPPRLLPTGARPRPVIKGRVGASSDALGAAGASAATDVVNPRSEGTAFAPKGQSGLITKSETSVPPPAPPVRTDAIQGDSFVSYTYAGGRQYAVTDGVSGLMTISNPTLAQNDWHTLGEFAVQTADRQQTVEVGWTVDRTTFGDDQTHLFVYHWVDGQESCYNCAFVPYSKATVRPGDVLPANAIKLFGIMHFKRGLVDRVRHGVDRLLPGQPVGWPVHPVRPDPGLRRGRLPDRPAAALLGHGQRAQAAQHPGRRRGEDQQLVVHERAGGQDRPAADDPDLRLGAARGERPVGPLRRCSAGADLLTH